MFTFIYLEYFFSSKYKLHHIKKKRKYITQTFNVSLYCICAGITVTGNTASYPCKLMIYSQQAECMMNSKIISFSFIRVVHIFILN